MVRTRSASKAVQAQGVPSNSNTSLSDTPIRGLSLIARNLTHVRNPTLSSERYDSLEGHQTPDLELEWDPHGVPTPGVLPGGSSVTMSAPELSSEVFEPAVLNPQR